MNKMKGIRSYMFFLSLLLLLFTVSAFTAIEQKDVNTVSSVVVKETKILDEPEEESAGAIITDTTVVPSPIISSINDSWGTQITIASTTAESIADIHIDSDTPSAAGGEESYNVSQPLIEEAGSVKVCAGSSEGFTECTTVREINVSPAPTEIQETASTTAVQPIELELEIGGVTEKIIISKNNSGSIEIEDSKGEKAETTEAIQIDEEGLKVNGNTVNVLPNNAINTVENSLGLINTKEIKLKIIQEKPMYEVRAVQQARFLWVIPVEMEIKTNINAQTGAIENIEKPWWSFLVG